MTGIRCWVFGIRCSVFGIVRSEHRTPNTQHRIPGRPGFTLIELLVALTMLAVIAGGMTLAFHTSLQAAGTIYRRAETADERRAVVARLRADLEGAWLRPESETTWFQALDAAAMGAGAVSGEGDSLSLTTVRSVSLDAVRADEGPDGAAGPQSDVAQVTWRLEPDVDGTQALVRWERTPPDPDYLLYLEQGVDISQDPAAVRSVVLRGVSGFNLRFFDGFEWWEEWDTAPPADGTVAEAEETAPMGLPRAVEVSLFRGEQQAAGRLQSLPGASALEGVPDLSLVVALPEPIELVVEEAP